ncbi:MAG: PAS domain-containing protein, partial [Deltaproteobacteria bacterium]|nr:PAS domain-containing protein [Deltaproteobacteria bacterium]
MSKKKRFFWQLFPSYLVITVISLVAVTWYALSTLEGFFLKHTAADLESRARLVEEQVLTYLDPPAPKAVDALCKGMGGRAATRITVVLANGKVVGDSDEDPDDMDNHLDRPEIHKAISNGLGMSRRHSRTLEKDMMYVGISVRKGGHILGVVRTAVSLSSLDGAMRATRIRIAVAGFFVALLAAGIGLLVSQRVMRPLREIRRGAERFARGELETRLPVSNSEEIGGLAETMNQMAGDLRERIDTVIRQRNEIEATLSSMVEGVIALDMEGRVISMNDAAGGMFACNASAAGGRSIQEIARTIDLQDLVTETLSSRDPIERDITFYDGEERHLNGHGNPLRDAEGRRIGALIVLNDVTRLKRLENMRRDFVANVSHEIKTPITAIKGFVETLHDGAMKNPADAERFLGIIGKHVNRLQAIIDDLLSLSKIEQAAETEDIVLETVNLREMLETTVQLCESNARPKQIVLELDCEDDLEAKLDATLMEQAVVNLIENAVKYNDGNGTVSIAAVENGDEIAIRVSDQGRGIEKRHLSRLFERFYRADNG